MRAPGQSLQAEMEVVLARRKGRDHGSGFDQESLARDAQARRHLLGMLAGSLLMMGLGVFLTL
ncbi:MAG: hypothetical protein FJX76_11565 [Armatimonadetes bacterium]|nr:hypothetical protein [Armatimonadota bacterium]